MPRPHAKFEKNWWSGLGDIGGQDTDFVQFL